MRRSFPPAERVMLAGGMVAASLVPLNSTMIAVGLPEIARDLDVSRSTVAWLVTTYLAAMALCQPIAGRAGDRFGSRRVTVVALTGFGLLSGVAAVAPTFPVLLAARVAQAVFGAALIPNVQALVRSSVDAERRGRAFGILGIGIGSGAALGPIVGGVLVDAAGWETIFLANVPAAALGVAMVARIAVDARPDVVEVHDGGRLLRGAFLAACVAQAAGNLAQYTTLLVVPLLLDARGWSGSEVGLALLSLTAGMLGFTPVGGAMGDRRGRAVPVVAGMVALVAGAALLAAVADEVPALLIASLVLIGIGAGLSNASLQAAALDLVPAPVAGAAAGVFSTSRYVGSISGSLLLAVVGPRPMLAVTSAGAVVALVAALRLRHPAVAFADR